MVDWRSVYTRTRRIPLVKSAVRRLLPVETQSLDGTTYRLYPGTNLTDREVWLHGAHPEAESLAALLAHVRSAQRALIVDIGANGGLFTLPLVKAAPADCRVVAIEPNPEMCRRLRENLALNDCADRVEIVECAVGRQVGTVNLILHASNLGQSSVLPHAKPSGTIKVPMRRLTDIVRDRLPFDALIVKIDIEGLEDAALLPLFEDGAPEMLPDILLLEMNSDRWSDDLEALLGARGYVSEMSANGNQLYLRRGGRLD